MTWIGCSDLTDWRDLAGAAEPVGGWCRDPELPAGVEEVSGVVGCLTDLDLHLFERRLRAAGLEPFSIPFVLLDPDEADDRERIGARLAAAAARAGAAPSVATRHLRLVMPSVVSRRTLFSFREPAYRLVPYPDPEICGAVDGCRACLAECPHGALTWSGAGLALDRLDCSGCGRCVVVCPAGAMVHPQTTPAQLDAYVQTVADEIERPFGIRFVCSRGQQPASVAEWFDLAIPCVGMIRPGWLIAPLLAGAGEVTVADCTCGIEDDVAARVTMVLDAANEILDAAGISPRRVHETANLIGLASLEVETAGSGFEPFGAVHAAATFGIAQWSGPLVDAGWVTIDRAICTGCEMCSTVCPSGALFAASADGSLTITFDAVRCTACGECVRTCPERGAIDLRRVLDGRAAGRGPATIVTHPLAECTKCGTAVATESVLARIAERLDDDAVFRQISSLCLDCRGTRMVFS